MKGLLRHISVAGLPSLAARFSARVPFPPVRHYTRHWFICTRLLAGLPVRPLAVHTARRKVGAISTRGNSWRVGVCTRLAGSTVLDRLLRSAVVAVRAPRTVFATGLAKEVLILASRAELAVRACGLNCDAVIEWRQTVIAKTTGGTTLALVLPKGVCELARHACLANGGARARFKQAHGTPDALVGACSFCAHLFVLSATARLALSFGVKPAANFRSSRCARRTGAACREPVPFSLFVCVCGAVNTFAFVLRVTAQKEAIPACRARDVFIATRLAFLILVLAQLTGYALCRGSVGVIGKSAVCTCTACCTIARPL
jgi:hypothetical protein